MKIIFLIIFLGICGHILSLQEVSETNFETLVKNDEHVWVIKFASKMCGSCKEFAPIFESIAKKNNKFKFGVVYIDASEGLNLAMNLDVLDNGLPAVLVFDKVEGGFNQIISGNVVKEDKYVQLLNQASKGLTLKNNLFLKKKVSSEL